MMGIMKERLLFENFKDIRMSRIIFRSKDDEDPQGGAGAGQKMFALRAFALIFG